MISMLTPLRYINCKGLSILHQLHFEEILLRKSNENFVIFNTNSAPTSIVVGYSGKIQELVHLEEVAANQVPLIRRYTGGGTVITDANTLFVTLILNSKDVKTQPYPRDIMDWTSKFLYEPLFLNVLQDRNMKFSLREHDYTLNDTKIGGNAQSITKNRFVHHTSFLWDFTRENMSLLQIPKKRPEYRQSRDHSSFLTKLKPYVSKEKFEELLIKQLHAIFSVTTINFEDRHELIKNLLGETDSDSVIRTKLENVNDYITDNPIMNSLVKQGPSCVNL